jgi:hypothetical protein
VVEVKGLPEDHPYASLVHGKYVHAESDNVWTCAEKSLCLYQIEETWFLALDSMAGQRPTSPGGIFAIASTGGDDPDETRGWQVKDDDGGEFEPAAGFTVCKAQSSTMGPLTRWEALVCSTDETCSTLVQMLLERAPSLFACTLVGSSDRARAPLYESLATPQCWEEGLKRLRDIKEEGLSSAVVQHLLESGGGDGSGGSGGGSGGSEGKEAERRPPFLELLLCDGSRHVQLSRILVRASQRAATYAAVDALQIAIALTSAESKHAASALRLLRDFQAPNAELDARVVSGLLAPRGGGSDGGKDDDDGSSPSQWALMANVAALTNELAKRAPQLMETRGSGKERETRGALGL